MSSPFNQRGSVDQAREGSSLVMGQTALSQHTPLQIVQPSPVSGIQVNALNRTNRHCKFLLPVKPAHVAICAKRIMIVIGDAANDWLGTRNQYQDMHHYHPSYMFNAPEVTNEYNLLNDFLNNSLLDDGLLESDGNTFYNDPSMPSTNGMNNHNYQAGLQPNMGGANMHGNAISRPSSVMPTDKAKEYYLQAADPTGNDTPEERMNRLLKAKYDAGMLKPFNYVKGYARLSSYMDGHMNVNSKQKILRQLDRFRPKFREKVQALTDIELIYVEMWFEKTLMEYDRVFASMAIPACCWRRTGEIFRGNKEMAELIHVPIEQLRDVG